MNINGVAGGATTGVNANGAIGAGGGTTAVRTELDTIVHAARTGSPLEQGQALHALDAASGGRNASDALVRGEEGTTLGADHSAETCSIEVRFKPVIGPTHHAFIVTTDGDSVNYFRGGPQANNTGLNSSSGTSGSNAQAPHDPQFGIYGPIVTEYGAYRQGTVDWTTEPSGQQTVARTPGNCDTVERNLARHMDDIEASRTNYAPLAANSNSTVREGLERAGFDNVEPVKWAPAWDTQLPNPR
jgi:hypothetical protein